MPSLLGQSVGADLLAKLPDGGSIMRCVARISCTPGGFGPVEITARRCGRWEAIGWNGQEFIQTTHFVITGGVVIAAEGPRTSYDFQCPRCTIRLKPGWDVGRFVRAVDRAMLKVARLLPLQSLREQAYKQVEAIPYELRKTDD